MSRFATMRESVQDECVKQSGAIPYRTKGDGGLEVLLVTAKRDGMWIIPKGHIEPDMLSGDSAAKEVWEEAGVKGRVSNQAVTAFSYRRMGRRYEVEVFILEVRDVFDEYPERGHRRREWMSLDEACSRLVSVDLKAAVRDLPRIAASMRADASEKP